MGVIPGSFNEFIDVVKALFVIVGPPVGLVIINWQFHPIAFEQMIQYIIDYAFFIAILYIFVLLNKIDKKMPQ